MAKMGKWKYSPNQIAPQISNVLLTRLKLRWEFYMQIAKDIYEQSLRQLLSSRTNVKVKEAMKKNEEKMTIRFHTWLILIKDIEHVVRDATNMCKNIYLLHKPSEDLVEIKDDDDDGDKDEDNEEDNTPCVTIDAKYYQDLMKNDEEEKEDEAEEEVREQKEEEESDPIRIATKVIASLPHSLVKIATSSSMETTSMSLIVTIKDASTIQSLFTPS